MQGKLLKRLSSILIASTAAAALLMGGCDGDDGRDGRDGLDAGEGPVTIGTLPAEQQSEIGFQGEVTGVTVSSPPVVRFRITDSNGNPIIGLGQRNAAGTQLNNLKFSLAKLIPSANGSPSRWVNYLVTTATTPVAATRPTQDREGTLVDNGDGTYQYTFFRDITQVQSQVAALTDAGENRKADLDDLTFDPNLTHRLVIEYGGNIINTSPSVAFRNPLNLIYDFIPATGARVNSTSGNTQREIVLTKYCNECHGDPGDPADLSERGFGIGITTPHNGRVDTRYCAICHTGQRAFGRAVSTPTAGAFTGNTYVTDDEVLGEFVTMVHKIHMGNRLTETGYNYAGVRFDELGYPQDAALCRKCHRGETAEQLAAAPQANNWHQMPSRKACGSCHDNVHFATGVGHSEANIVQLNDTACNTCHPSQAVKSSHALVNLTPNNPETLAGLVNFTYDINSATIDPATNNLAIQFRVLGDGTPVTFVTPAAGVTAPLTGFTGSPAFLLAYALPQIGFNNTTTAAPADYNNLGKPAAQPDSISIAALLNTDNAAVGSITGPGENGYYTATINAARAFPAGATMRSVSLQSYFTQVAPAAARHAVAVVKPVTGDAVRRVVVDPNKCANCHEWFEAHGGQRVFQTQVCVTCHNPNLTTSGRTITDARLAGFNAMQQGILLGWDPAFSTTTPGYALLFPETSNNFKEMIHGIHAGGTRTSPFRDVRGDRLAVIDAEDFVFPNLLQRCEACHVTDTVVTNRHTFDVNLPPNVLPTTMVTNDATTPATQASKAAARLTVPNPQDLVVAPITGACLSCHDSPTAKAHMNANGGQLGAALNGPSYTDVGVPRSTLGLNAEQCVLCHGEGRIADVVVVHDR